MDITIYLPDDLGKWAKEHELPLSRMLREAVEDQRRRRDAASGLASKAKTYKLDIRETDGLADGDDNITVRLHGTLIATQKIGRHGSTEVYRGEDGKIYVHDYDGELHRDIEPGALRDYVDEPTYIKAMRALREEVIIDVGLPE